MSQLLQLTVISWKPTATEATGLPTAVFAVPLIVSEPAAVLAAVLAGVVGPTGALLPLNGDVPEPEAPHPAISQITKVAAAAATVVRRTLDRCAQVSYDLASVTDRTDFLR